MDLLTVEHVTKRYASHTALDDVSLAIPKGSVLLLFRLIIAPML